MFKFCSLYSGSSGNSSLIQTNNTKILIDAGVSCKKITEALESININPFDIDAVLITHEHSDHTSGIGLFSKKYNIPVYANKETWNALSNQRDKIEKNNIKFFEFKKFNVGDLSVLPFKIPHDAANPCGFNIYYNDKKISIATDIGHITSDVINNLENSSFILLEANYDPNILQCSRYPYILKQRIASSTGHLSNQAAGEAISYLSKRGLNSVMLGHLSKENNFPELAYKTVVEQLMENNCEQKLSLLVADRYNTSPIIDVS